MTTDEVLTVIATAKRRADVVPAMAATFAQAEGVDYGRAKRAVEAKWSQSAYVWILKQAWKIIDAKEAPHA